MATVQKTIEFEDVDPRLLFGTDHSNLALIEKEVDVEIVARGDWINIRGEAANVDKAERIIRDIIDHVRATGELNERYILYSIAIISENGQPPSQEMDIDTGLITSAATQKVVKPKTVGQKHYVDLIEARDIVFSIGPAGTGKTYLAVAMAVRASVIWAASRWHAPPVTTAWTSRLVCRARRSASFWVCTSPVTTAIPSSSPRASRVRSRSRVFPEPGEETRLKVVTPASVRRRRTSAARASRWRESRSPTRPSRCT